MTDASSADLATLWNEVCDELRASLLPSTYELWLAPLTPAALRGGSLYLTAPPAVLPWVERRYGALIAEAARRRNDSVREVTLLPAGQQLPAEESGAEEELSVPNPDYSFERFVIGAGTRLAHAAALAVAEAPGEAYNPLFLYGPPGLGKTHLLAAIANYIASRDPGLSVRYTTAERFTSEFVSAIRADGTAAFKRRHRQADVLLIDDVQFLAGKQSTSEEFFHTFNALHEAGSQLVLSSDRPPTELAPLADRLRDRFEWGLLAELTPPDMPTRQAILRRLVDEGEIPVDDPEALDSIALGASGNVRQLEGALTRVAAASSLHGKPIDADLAASVLGTPSAPFRPSGEPTVERIQAAAGRALGVDPAVLAGTGRAPALVRARHVAMYLARDLTSLSLPRIGAAFNRDHTTVMHAVRKITRERDTDANLAATISQLHNELSPAGAATHPDREHCENRQPSHRGSPQAGTKAESRVHNHPQP